MKSLRIDRHWTWICLLFAFFLTNGARHLLAQKRVQKAAPPSRSLLILSDADCSLEIDGASTFKIAANKPMKIPTEEGEHILICTTNTGWRGTQQVDVQPLAFSPRQIVVNIALADSISRQEAEKQRQDQDKADSIAKEKAKGEENAASLAEAHGRFYGSWTCDGEGSVVPTAGMGVLGGTGVGTATTVPVFIQKNVILSLYNEAGQPPRGHVIVGTHSYMLGYTEAQRRGDHYFYTFSADPACFNSTGGQCVVRSATAWRYEITGDEASSASRIRVVLGRGECKGDCGSNPYTSPGKKVSVTFPAGNPGFYFDGIYCNKNSD